MNEERKQAKITYEFLLLFLASGGGDINQLSLLTPFCSVPVSAVSYTHLTLPTRRTV